MNSRPAKDIIDEAIAENRTASNLMYLFAFLFVSVGLAVLVVGVIQENLISGGLGAIASLLFWPSMTAARRTRRENIAIRLLEAPLTRADTARDASDMLSSLLNDILGNEKKDG